MEDFSMTLCEKESATVHTRLGSRIPKTAVSCFLWAEKANSFSIAISVEGAERFVVEVSDRGNVIDVTKSMTNDLIGKGEQHDI